MSDIKSHQALPSYGQWRTFCEAVRAAERIGRCIHCMMDVTWMVQSLIFIGARIKLWDEEVITHGDGTEEVKLKSRVVGVNMRGMGCVTCQHLMTSAVAAEMRRYEDADKEWHRLHKPAITIPHITVEVNGRRYYLHGDTWYDQYALKVPTALNTALHGMRAEQYKEQVADALEPWMIAMGFTQPLAHSAGSKESDSQTRTPSKRQAYLDVTEAVLKMPKQVGKQRHYDDSKPEDGELV